jgi:beta-lactamase class A
MPATGFAAKMHQALRHVDVHGRIHVAAWELGVEDGKLFIRGEEVVPAANTIKVPILAAALKEVGSGRLELERSMPLPTRRAGGSGVVQALTGLVSLTSLTLADLLTLMAIVSDNAATNIIIELLGMDPINAFCTEQGLGGTVLRRRMMDTKPASQGFENTTTALDQAKLLDAVADGALLLRTFALQALAAQQFTDALPSLLPDSVQVAHKTGELPGVRHDVGIITAANGRRAVVSVLVTGLDGGLIAPRTGDAGPVESPQSFQVNAGNVIAAVGYAAWRALERSV